MRQNILLNSLGIRLNANACFILLPPLFPQNSTCSIGYEKLILLYNPITLDVADVISSYVYRTGLVEGNYSFGSAVGLFNSVVNLILVVAANKASKKLTDVSLW